MQTTVATMTRSELARDVRVNRVTLWKWERAGLIPAPRRVSRNRAEFSSSAILMARSLAEARGHA